MLRTFTRIAFVILFFPLISFSQAEGDSTAPEGPWKNDLKFSVGLNQSAFSENWTGGGINSIGLQSLFNLKAKYTKNKWNWANEIDLLYGFVNNDGQGYRKTQDRIFLDTKGGYEVAKHWDAFLSLNFLSQFAEGFKYEKDVFDRDSAVKISDFLAPAFITAAIGMEYKPVDYFFVRFSPYAPRATIVRDTTLYRGVPENYGVEVGETVRYEWAAFQLLANFDKEVAKNLRLKARYLMYADYERPLDEIDHRLDALVSMKLANYIDLGLTAILIYDVDQVNELQWNQALTFNFVYTFKNYSEE